MPRIVTFLALLAVVGMPLYGEETPADVTPCQLASDPPKYNQKLVRVRSRVTLGFEDFSLYPADCPDARFQVWLAFGGDVETPTIYCCGSHARRPGRDLKVEGFRIPLAKDASFDRFLKLLKDAREANPNGDPCYDQECNLHEVTATLVGRFFSGKPWKSPRGEILYMGYGHMGMASLFAIQRVLDVEDQPTGVTLGKFGCSTKERTWKEASAARPACDRDRATDCLADHVLQEGMTEWGDAARLDNHGIEGDITNRDYDANRHVWRTRDGLLIYKLELRQYCKKPGSGWSCGDATWQPFRLTREECKPMDVP